MTLSVNRVLAKRPPSSVLSCCSDSEPVAVGANVVFILLIECDDGRFDIVGPFESVHDATGSERAAAAAAAVDRAHVIGCRRPPAHYTAIEYAVMMINACPLDAESVHCAVELFDTIERAVYFSSEIEPHVEAVEIHELATPSA